MDSEIEELKQLVRQNIEITKATREELVKMRRAARWGTIMRWVWRLLIIGVFAYAYYAFVVPYVEQLMQLYQAVQGSAEQAGGFGSQFSEFLRNFIQ